MVALESKSYVQTRLHCSNNNSMHYNDWIENRKKTHTHTHKSQNRFGCMMESALNHKVKWISMEFSNTKWKGTMLIFELNVHLGWKLTVERIKHTIKHVYSSRFNGFIEVYSKGVEHEKKNCLHSIKFFFWSVSISRCGCWWWWA